MGFVSRLWILALLATCEFALPAACRADLFDDHTAYWLKQVVDKQPSIESLSMKDGAKLKPIGRRLTSPCVVIKTDDENYAKALLAWGMRKNKDTLTPVVVIERFVTYRGDRPNITTAAGKEVMLFPGFQFNFDIGQVVPEGQGGDLKCGPDGTLEVIPSAKLFALSGPAIPVDPKESLKPSNQVEVLPTDFAGQWQVHIDGRWTGRWELKVDERRVYGKFISDETQSEYEINGHIAASAHNLRLDVELANTSQSVDGFLWTKDKSAMAGTVVIADRKVGFYAIRMKAE